MAHRYQQFLCACKQCGSSTSRKYAREHSGLCKRCAEPEAKASDKPTRNERILESGYQAYAREEGHYDQGDN
jgi:hypothetical protein